MRRLIDYPIVQMFFEFIIFLIIGLFVLSLNSFKPATSGTSEVLSENTEQGIPTNFPPLPLSWRRVY